MQCLYPTPLPHYFLGKELVPSCLENSYIVENYQNDKEDIKAFLYSPIDSSVLGKLKTRASLVEAPNIDKKPKEEDLRVFFEDITEMKERNSKIVEAYVDGYSQHMIAKVLGISQPAVNGVICRNR